MLLQVGQKFIGLFNLTGRKDKNNAGNTGAAAHGTGCMPEKGHAAPGQKLLGSATG